LKHFASLIRLCCELGRASIMREFGICAFMVSIAKKLLLVGIGIAICLFALMPGSPDRLHPLLAQESPMSPQETPTPTFTPTETPTGTPTPTPGTPTATPTKVKRVINEVTEPKAGNAVAGIVNIRGTALVDSFYRYDIHLSAAGLENWQWLASSHAVIHDDLLHSLDSKQFSDGFYDLRVRAIQDSGGYTETFVRGLEIRNANPPTLTPIPGATSTPVSLLPTPTPTPDIRSRQPNGGQGFYAPDNGAVLRGVVNVAATVNGPHTNPFVRYELALSPADMERWNWLHSGEQTAWQETIYIFDTTTIPDGMYDLRLRIVYRDGNYNEYYLRRLSIANQGPPSFIFAPLVGIIAPRNYAEVSGIVEFVATVPATDLLQWELYGSPSGQEQWMLLVSGENSVTNSVLARLDLSQLPAGLYDFRLRIIRADHNYNDYFVHHLSVAP
jgi:hypothetical protein